MGNCSSQSAVMGMDARIVAAGMVGAQVRAPQTALNVVPLCLKAAIARLLFRP